MARSSRSGVACRRGSVDAGWAVPTMGGPLQPYLKGVSELDWSPDGTRIVYHPPAEGDPLFVTGPNEKVGRQIYVARSGFHNHFPVWSPDGAFIYFVHGLPLDESDIWRIRSEGGEPERLTFHGSRVTFPTFLNNRTLLYLASDHDGSGPWIYAWTSTAGYPAESARASNSTHRCRPATTGDVWWRRCHARRNGSGVRRLPTVLLTNPTSYRSRSPRAVGFRHESGLSASSIAHRKPEGTDCGRSQPMAQRRSSGMASAGGPSLHLPSRLTANDSHSPCSRANARNST